MTTAERIIHHVESVGGRIIIIDDDRVRIRATRGSITPDVVELLRQHKREIISK
jgi:hypothetical protein